MQGVNIDRMGTEMCSVDDETRMHAQGNGEDSFERRDELAQRMQNWCSWNDGDSRGAARPPHRCGTHPGVAGTSTSLP